MRRGWAAFAGAAALVGLGFWLWNSDPRQINRRLSHLLKLGGKNPVETQFQGARKAKAISDLFAQEFELIAEPENYATTSRQDLIRAIVAYRSRSTTLTLDLVRQELFLDPTGASATQYAYIRFVTDLRGLLEAETFPVRMQWVEQDGEWLVEKLEVLAEE